MIKNDEVELQWETFLFYQSESAKVENVHLDNIQCLEHFIANNINPNQKEKKINLKNFASDN